MPNRLDHHADAYVIPLDYAGDELLNVDTSPSALGWTAYFSSKQADLGAEVLLRLALVGASEPARASSDERDVRRPIHVKELRVLVGPRTPGFASSLLRELPILRVEAAVNQARHRDRIAAAAQRATVEEEPVLGGTSFRSRPTRAAKLKPVSLALTDPGGYRKPDSFYQRVADLYLDIAAVSPRPAQDIASANGVPVATVHRWIREAKARRLLLLPAHREVQ